MWFTHFVPLRRSKILSAKTANARPVPGFALKLKNAM
jgi:hypothetical protein